MITIKDFAAQQSCGESIVYRHIRNHKEDLGDRVQKIHGKTWLTAEGAEYIRSLMTQQPINVYNADALTRELQVKLEEKTAKIESLLDEVSALKDVVIALKDENAAHALQAAQTALLSAENERLEQKVSDAEKRVEDVFKAYEDAKKEFEAKEALMQNTIDAHVRQIESMKSSGLLQRIKGWREKKN